MLRREFGTGLLSILLAQRAIAAFKHHQQPPLYRFTRGRSRIFMLGFGGAKDESWATPQVRDAFKASSELWLEVSHDPGSEPDAATKREQLGIAPDRIEQQRPWSAFYKINGAFWSRHTESFARSYPDETLMTWAKEQGKPIRYEMPSQLDFARFMAAMPDAAQSQYITFLLDFLDDQNTGRTQGEFDWIHGDTTVGERAVDRLRTRTPDLYRVMQVQRNAW